MMQNASELYRRCITALYEIAEPADAEKIMPCFYQNKKKDRLCIYAKNRSIIFKDKEILFPGGGEILFGNISFGVIVPDNCPEIVIIANIIYRGAGIQFTDTICLC